MAASYSQILSIKHSLDCRLVLESDWYKQIFPQTILSKKHNQKSKFLTTMSGFRFATSVGGSATGEGGDFLIVDDPHNPLQISSSKMRLRVIEWFNQTFLTRLNNQNKGSVVLVMQRLNAEDLSGHLLSNNSDWQHLKIPVRADKTYIFANNHSYKLEHNQGNSEKTASREEQCRGISREYDFLAGEVLHNHRNHSDYLLKLEQEIGNAAFAAQYMQEPVESGYSLLKIDDINFYDVVRENFDYFIQSWDTAIKISEDADYSVCTCWGIVDNSALGGYSQYYLVSMIRHKFSYPGLKIELQKQATKYHPRFILIEDKASGQQLIQDLKLEGFSNIVAIKPKLDKITRFAASVPLFQSGQVLIPKRSSFKLILIREITSFPNSKNDDIVDSISQFLNFVKGLTAKVTARIRGF